MKLTIPSTTIKAKFLKTLPINTIYQDSRNEYAYQVVGKECGGSLTKMAVPYIGQ